MSGDVEEAGQTWGQFQSQCDALVRDILVLAKEGSDSKDFEVAAVTAAIEVALLSHFIGKNHLEVNGLARQWVVSGEFLRFAAQIHEHLGDTGKVSKNRTVEIGDLARRTRQLLPER